jgi:hypothetical protein
MHGKRNYTKGTNEYWSGIIFKQRAANIYEEMSLVGRTNERTDSRSPIYPNLFLANVYKSYQKLTLEILRKPTLSCKSTFFPFDLFSLKKKNLFR